MKLAAPWLGTEQPSRQVRSYCPQLPGHLAALRQEDLRLQTLRCDSQLTPTCSWDSTGPNLKMETEELGKEFLLLPSRQREVHSPRALKVLPPSTQRPAH